jgi:hypothetical protein
MNAVSIRLAQHTGDARREHVPQRMGKMGGEPTRDGSDFTPSQQRVLLELLDVEGSEQVTDMVAAQPVQGWQNLSCAIKRYARFGVRRFTESGILYQHRIDCFHQRARTEDPVQAGKRGDVVEVVRGRSQVGREHEKGLSTGTQDTIDLSDGCRRGLDVFQNVVGDHHVDGRIGKRDLHLCAQTEFNVTHSERSRVSGCQIDVSCEGFDAHDGACLSSVLNRSASIPTSEIQQVFSNDRPFEIDIREESEEFAEQCSLSRALRKWLGFAAITEILRRVSAQTSKAGVLRHAEQLRRAVSHQIHGSPRFLREV